MLGLVIFIALSEYKNILLSFMLISLGLTRSHDELIRKLRLYRTVMALYILSTKFYEIVIIK